MRLPMFDGMLPGSGPVHLVSIDGDAYLLIAQTADTPGRVEELATASADRYEPYLDQDVMVRGDVLGTVIWTATVLEIE